MNKYLEKIAAKLDLRTKDHIRGVIKSFDKLKMNKENLPKDLMATMKDNFRFRAQRSRAKGDRPQAVVERVISSRWGKYSQKAEK